MRKNKGEGEKGEGEWGFDVHCSNCLARFASVFTNPFLCLFSVCLSFTLCFYIIRSFFSCFLLTLRLQYKSTVSLGCQPKILVANLKFWFLLVLFQWPMSSNIFVLIFFEYYNRKCVTIKQICFNALLEWPTQNQWLFCFFLFIFLSFIPLQAKWVKVFFLYFFICSHF